MKIKMLTLLNSIPALEVLQSQKINAKTSLLISRTAKKIKEEIATYDELKKKLVEEYGVFNEEVGGKVVTPENENYALVNSELNEVLETEIELAIEPMNIESFNSVLIEPAYLNALDFLFE